MSKRLYLSAVFGILLASLLLAAPRQETRKNGVFLASNSLATGGAGAEDFVSVKAVYTPPSSPGADGAVEARFTVSEPQVVVNEAPPPRLRLDPLQRVLIDKQPPATRGSGAVGDRQAKHLDLSRAVRLPVALSPSAPRGQHVIAATIIYYYCSKRESWCRKGRSETQLNVVVP
jgi:hypothetical protein